MKKELVFKRKNYTFMLIGLVFIAFGFILMSGGGSDNPDVFSEDIFNFQRISLSPFLILLGFAIQIYAILLHPDENKK